MVRAYTNVEHSLAQKRAPHVYTCKCVIVYSAAGSCAELRTITPTSSRAKCRGVGDSAYVVSRLWLVMC